MKRLRLRLRKWIVTYILLNIAWLLQFTLRKRLYGLDEIEQAAAKGPTILALWHNKMMLIPWTLYFHAKTLSYTMVVSKSRDGALLTAAARPYQSRLSVIQVAHTSRHHALKEMVRRAKKGEILMVTPDGPRGPAHKVKKGVAFTAKMAGAAVVPFSWSCDRYWKLKSWDGFIIPKPFSRVVIRFGAAVDESQEESVDLLSDVIEQRLNKLTTRVEEELAAQKAKKA